MNTLLRIDASATPDDKSHSRSLADHFVSHWRTLYPGGRLLHRDLAATPPPHLDSATVAVFAAGGMDPGHGSQPGLAWSDRLIAEIREADAVIVSSALYNFGPPSGLKAWVDHIVRFGHTIAYGRDGVHGLMKGKSACLLTARGGNPATTPDFHTPLLETVFRYIGFTRVHAITLEGTLIPDGGLERRIEEARSAIDDWLAQAPEASTTPGH